MLFCNMEVTFDLSQVRLVQLMNPVTPASTHEPPGLVSLCVDYMGTLRSFPVGERHPPGTQMVSDQPLGVCLLTMTPILSLPPF